MSDKPLLVVLIELLVAAAAVAGVFMALKAFQIPNCTTVAKHELLMWAPRLSVVLAGGAISGFIIGAREGSQLSKAIGSFSVFAAIFLWGIYKWKLNAILMAAC
jgi:hypothetical protein